jgi:hypothetical protein
VLFGLGINGNTGEVSRNWANTAAGTGVPVDKWSLRLSGTITFPQAGAYTIRTFADDATMVWIDDVQLVSELLETGERFSLPGTFTATAVQTARIRIQYVDASAAAKLELHWTPPGGVDAVVPGTQLKPDYGLVTGTTVDDSVAGPSAAGLTDAQVPDLTASTAYTNPWLGSPTSSTVDPTGLALTTAETYETLGSCAESAA